MKESTTIIKIFKCYSVIYILYFLEFILEHLAVLFIISTLWCVEDAVTSPEFQLLSAGFTYILELMWRFDRSPKLQSRDVDLLYASLKLWILRWILLAFPKIRHKSKGDCFAITSSRLWVTSLRSLVSKNLSKLSLNQFSKHIFIDFLLCDDVSYTLLLSA